MIKIWVPFEGSYSFIPLRYFDRLHYMILIPSILVAHWCLKQLNLSWGNLSSSKYIYPRCLIFFFLISEISFYITVIRTSAFSLVFNPITQVPNVIARIVNNLIKSLCWLPFITIPSFHQNAFGHSFFTLFKL